MGTLLAHKLERLDSVSGDEKLGGGALNSASTSTFKKLMKALSYLMGQRCVYVPKALTHKIIEAVCSTVRVGSVDEMTAASVLVADFVWGARAAELVPHGLVRAGL